MFVDMAIFKQHTPHLVRPSCSLVTCSRAPLVNRYSGNVNLVRLFPQNSPIQYEETCCCPYSCPHCQHSPSNPIPSAPPRHFRSIFSPHTTALSPQMSHSLFPSTNPSLPAPYISPSHSQLFFPAQPPNLTTNNAQQLPPALLPQSVGSQTPAELLVRVVRQG
jgi:hypothetical protein